MQTVIAGKRRIVIHGRGADAAPKFSVFRARVNLENFSDPEWVKKGGWSKAQVAEAIREAKAIIASNGQSDGSETRDAALKLIASVDRGEIVAKIYRNAEFDEYQVKLFIGGKYQGEATDYFTDDKNDAFQTASAMIAHAAQHATAGDTALLDFKVGQTVKFRKYAAASAPILTGVIQYAANPKVEEKYNRIQVKGSDGRTYMLTERDLVGDSAHQTNDHCGCPEAHAKEQVADASPEQIEARWQSLRKKTKQELVEIARSKQRISSIGLDTPRGDLISHILNHEFNRKDLDAWGK